MRRISRRSLRKPAVEGHDGVRNGTLGLLGGCTLEKQKTSDMSFFIISGIRPVSLKKRLRHLSKRFVWHCRNDRPRKLHARVTFAERQYDKSRPMPGN
jgi:hypothetical protein